MTPWYLGGQIRGSDGKFRFEAVRELSEPEIASLDRAVGIAGAFAGRTVLGPLEHASNRLVEAVERHDPRGEMDQLALAFTSWLAEVRAMRAKLESAVHRIDESRSIPALLALHRSAPEFRLAWELRNAEQHGAGAARFISVSISDDVWFYLDLQAIWKAHEEDKSWRSCRALWPDVIERVGLLDLVRAVFCDCEHALHEALRDNESDLQSAVDLIANTLAEALDALGSCQPLWYRMEGTAAAGTRLNVHIQAPAITMGHLAGSLEAMRSADGRGTTR
ncbi:hypothetical protein [Agromyces bauzanensis]